MSQWDITENKCYEKIVLLSSVLLFLATFTSCFKDKDGEYKPKEKISRIFKDYGEGEGKRLAEIWHWDKKLLKSIDHYSGGSLSWTEEFTYNKKTNWNALIAMPMENM